MPSSAEMDRAAARRVAIFDSIATSVRDRGYPPTVSELARDHEVSKTQIRLDLGILEELGKIERDGGEHRGIRLVVEQPAPAEV